ncbi:MAG TPA: hypothetical protein VF708_17145 [Pyrinomonadaceae bacterium]|jgi:hypothetical protein
MINRNKTFASITPLVMLPLIFLFAGFALETQSLPQGVYTVTIADENFPAKFPAEGRPALKGKWELTLMEEGKSRITKDGVVTVEGHYSATADRFIITDETGSLSCAKETGKETGIYKWTLNGDKLVLKGIDDKCDGRRFILTLLPWMKQK